MKRKRGTMFGIRRVAHWVFCLALFVGSSNDARAAGQFEGRLACYDDLQTYTDTMATASSFLSFEKKPDSLLSFGKSLVTDHKGYGLVLPSTRDGARGFYIVESQGMYWKAFSQRPIPGAEDLRYQFQFTLPGLGKRQPLFISYSDSLNPDGTEDPRPMISIGLTPQNNPLFRGQVEKVTGTDALRQDAEMLLNTDLIKRIRTIPGQYRRMEERRQELLRENSPVGRDIRGRKQFQHAISACRKRLNRKSDTALLQALREAEAAISSDPTAPAGPIKSGVRIGR